MARKLKTEQHRGEVADVENAYSTLTEELGGEMREWYDNMSENLQGGDKGSQVEEAASTLEGLECPDVPEAVAGLEITYTQQHKGGKKGDPRWLRRDNEVSIITAAAETVRGWIDDAQQAITDSELPDDAEDDSTLQFREEDWDLGALKSAIEEAETFADALESSVSDAEGVEFPGMYG